MKSMNMIQSFLCESYIIPKYVDKYFHTEVGDYEKLSAIYLYAQGNPTFQKK